MIEKLRKDAEMIMNYSISKVMPEETVINGLQSFVLPEGRVILVSIGKAAWHMANTAVQKVKVDTGIVITKYGHIYGEIEGVTCFEAGHPLVDENSIATSEEAVKLVENLTEKDIVLLLVSGGASALFEKPLISLDELRKVNDQLLKCGADIHEINAIRKRLSSVKGGKFAKICEPAHVYSILLSDVLGNDPSVIGSGPSTPDSSTCEEVAGIVDKYGLQFSERVNELLKKETPKTLENVETYIGGSVDQLCAAASEICSELDYETKVITTSLQSEASLAGIELANMIETVTVPTAIIEGGETVVHVKGSGLGGRNQELALSACDAVAGKNACVFSFSSDGTDGPTDAAGGYVDGESRNDFLKQGIDYREYLSNNDSYNALKLIDGLLITEPTGTNVNDVSIALILPE